MYSTPWTTLPVQCGQWTKILKPLIRVSLDELRRYVHACNRYFYLYICLFMNDIHGIYIYINMYTHINMYYIYV